VNNYTIKYKKTLNEFGIYIANEIIKCGKIAINTSDTFTMAISGGSTPEIVFKYLTQPNYISSINWSKVHLFFTDERCVHANSKRNNFKNCHSLWLKHIENINSYRIKGWMNPLKAAQEYEITFKNIVPNDSKMPKLDLIFMGMGSDGHIASLFPDYNFKQEISNFFEHTYASSLNEDRVTMTLPLINSAKKKIVGIIGKEKESIFSSVYKKQMLNLPVSYLKTRANDRWVVCS
tara:strand:+ start:1926 stop:2627 length:702 start_codon:yes stop_codon:yes gene_type:complete